MVDTSKDTKILNTLHATGVGNKIAHASEVVLDDYGSNTSEGDVVQGDNVESAIRKTNKRIDVIDTKYQSLPGKVTELTTKIEKEISDRTAADTTILNKVNSLKWTVQ